MIAVKLERRHLIRGNTLVTKADFLDKLISNRLDSDENAKCVLVEHLINPWGVLKGYSPDFDGVDAITRFRNDCVEVFCKRANYKYEHRCD